MTAIANGNVKEIVTHDFSKGGWGHRASVMSLGSSGKKIRLAVWSSKSIRDGDYMIIPNGKDTTRYQAAKVTKCQDPDDMYFIDAVFAPRSE